MANDHEIRLSGLEEACGQLAANDQAHMENERELAAALRSAQPVFDGLQEQITNLRRLVEMQGEELRAIADVCSAQAEQIGKLNEVVSRHHRFFEELFERTEESLGPDAVN